MQSNLDVLIGKYIKYSLKYPELQKELNSLLELCYYYNFKISVDK